MSSPAPQIKDLPLVRASELCTVTYMPAGDTAEITMDDPFFVRSSNLFMLSEKGDGSQVFGLAGGYQVRIVLQPCDTNAPWPPLLDSWTHWSTWRDRLRYHLVTTIDIQGTNAPHTKCYAAELEIPSSSKRERAGFSMEVAIKWSILKANNASPPIQKNPLRLPTPNTSTEEAPKGQLVITSYNFLAAVDDSKYHDVYGRPNSVGQHSFAVDGYVCPFCDNRPFQALKNLHFHLVIAHDTFHFKVRPRKVAASRKGDRIYDRYIDIQVGLARDATVSRASTDIRDTREIMWIKPARALDIDKIVAGDLSWLKERPLGYRQAGGFGALRPGKIEWHKVKDLPVRPSRRYKIPEPRTAVVGKVYLRTQSKRYVEPGEILSDSDEDVDEEWLIRKHEEVSSKSRGSSAFMLWAMPAH
jgi:hypothetical protein